MRPNLDSSSVNMEWEWLPLGRHSKGPMGYFANASTTETEQVKIYLFELLFLKFQRCFVHVFYEQNVCIYFVQKYYFVGIITLAFSNQSQKTGEFDRGFL